MANHSDAVAPSAIHPFAYVQSTDPGAVGANKGWLYSAAGAPYQAYVRNSGNTAWVAVGSGLRDAVKATLSADQAIPTAIATALLPTTEAYDNNTLHYTQTTAITGTVTKTASSATLTGSGTLFTSELAVGQVISVPGTTVEYRVVTAIASATSLTVATGFVNSGSGQTATRYAGALVVRTAGIYTLMGSVLWSASTAGYLQVRKNATTIMGESVPNYGTSRVTSLAIPDTAVQWDWYELLLNQSSGGSINAVSDARTYFAMHLQ